MDVLVLKTAPFLLYFVTPRRHLGEEDPFRRTLTFG
jgi:hypothetical protein